MGAKTIILYIIQNDRMGYQIFFYMFYDRMSNQHPNAPLHVCHAKKSWAADIHFATHSAAKEVPYAVMIAGLVNFHNFREASKYQIDSQHSSCQRLVL